MLVFSIDFVVFVFIFVVFVVVKPIIETNGNIYSNLLKFRVFFYKKFRVFGIQIAL